jgi:circadian clock protein KaiC
MKSATSELGTLARLETGNEKLDMILGGGFPASSINILMGEPGCGKTIVAESLVFANAGGDRPILYLTTLSEPLDKIVRYLQQFTFFDEAKLGSQVIYESVGDDLVEHGIAALAPRLKDAITSIRPKIIVIDSFKAIHDLATSTPDVRRMLFEVAGLLTAYDTTAFFVGEYSSADMASYPEFAVADGVVELARDKLGTRDERYLRVLKLRGSTYLEGLHAFRLSRDGIEVFPRLTTPHFPPKYVGRTDRVSTGIGGLDALLGGGVPRGRSTFVLGPTGSGKTTLGLQFVLDGAERGEAGLYVHFEENPTQLAEHVASLDGGAEKVDRIRFLYRSPVELQIDSFVSEMDETVRRDGVRRIVVDAVGELVVAASDQQRLVWYLYALAQHFAVQGVTSLFLYQRAEAEASHEPRLSALADNILQLDIERGAKARRTLRVVKARGIAHDLETHALAIANGRLVFA